MRILGLLAGAVFILGSLTPSRGQAPIQFDAATIKLDQRGPGERGMKGGPGTNSPGRVTWQKVWLGDLVAAAFHLDPNNVSGPEWISHNGAQLYALTATMPPETSGHDFELMLQSFLIEQFKIKIHHEPKAFKAYELVVASGGAKLKASAAQNAPEAGVARIGDKIDSDGFPVFTGHGVRSTAILGFHGRFQNFAMAEFAEFLIGSVTPQGDPTRYVVDKTGLTGAYDFTLKFDQDERSIVLGPQVQAAMGARDNSEPGSGLPNIFKALEQQLGLRLVKARDVPLDTIVIDHAERIPAGS